MESEDHMLDRLLSALSVPAARCATVNSFEELMGDIFDWSNHESEVNTRILFPDSTVPHKPQEQGTQGPAASHNPLGHVDHHYPPQPFTAATAAAAFGDAPLLQQQYAAPTYAQGYNSQTLSAVTSEFATYEVSDRAFVDSPEGIDWQALLQQQQHEQIMQQQTLLQETSYRAPQLQVDWTAMQQQQQQQQLQLQQQVSYAQMQPGYPQQLQQHQQLYQHHQQQNLLLHPAYTQPQQPLRRQQLPAYFQVQVQQPPQQQQQPERTGPSNYLQPTYGQPQHLPVNSHQQHQQQQQRQQVTLKRRPSAAAAAAARSRSKQSITTTADRAPDRSSSSSESDDDDDQDHDHDANASADGPRCKRQQQQQQGVVRRGRPPKKSGRYSKGYLATKRYRERKQGMVSQLHDDIAAKCNQLQQLEEEQQALLRRHKALSTAISLHEDLWEYLAAMKISGDPQEDDSGDYVTDSDQDHDHDEDPDQIRSETRSAAAADSAAVDAAPSDVSNKSSMIVQLQQQWQQQQQQQQQQSEQPVAAHILSIWGRYKNYVTSDCAKALAADVAAAAAARSSSEGRTSADRQQQQQQDGDSHNVHYPEFPFNLVEGMELFNLFAYSSNKNSTTPPSAAAAAAADGKSVGPSLMNLITGKQDTVTPDYWITVSKTIALSSEQKQRLAAAFKLFAAAVARITVERQQLQERLEDLLKADAAASFDVYNTSPSSSAAAAAAGDSAAAAAAAVAKGATLAASIDSLQAYFKTADRIDWNLVRARAAIVLYGWSLMELLDNKQKAQLCVASWPYFPMMRAVFGNLLAGSMQQQQQQQQ